ncbi:hypothetical protein BH09MYX1_BH09MYX1_48270 [soil metagenome]
MLTPDVRFEGWTAEDWMRFVEVWSPQRDVARAPSLGGLIVIHDGAKLVKILHTVRGRVAPGGTWPTPLAELAKENEASWAVAGELGALEEVMERYGARTKRGDDMIVQALSLVGIVRELMLEGKIETWPQRLRGVPVPSETVVRRSLDALVADEKVLALGLFQNGELWTSFVARRRGPGIDVIAGPDELRQEMGLLSGDFRRDYQHFVHAVEQRYGELSLGCFAEVPVFRALQVDGRSGAWSKAVAMRDVVLSPIPIAVGLALSVDTTRFAIGKLRRFRPLLDPFNLAEPIARSIRERAFGPADKDLVAMLGFSPLEILRLLLRRD